MLYCKSLTALARTCCLPPSDLLVRREDPTSGVIPRQCFTVIRSSNPLLDYGLFQVRDDLKMSCARLVTIVSTFVCQLLYQT